MLIVKWTFDCICNYIFTIYYFQVTEFTNEKQFNGESLKDPQKMYMYSLPTTVQFTQCTFL